MPFEQQPGVVWSGSAIAARWTLSQPPKQFSALQVDDR